MVYVFVKDTPLSWNFTDYTLLGSITASIGGFLMLVIFPICRKYVNVEDTTIAIVSGIADVAYYAILGFATSTELVYLGNITFIICSHRFNLTSAFTQIMFLNPPNTKVRTAFLKWACVHMLRFGIRAGLKQLMGVSNVTPT